MGRKLADEKRTVWVRHLLEKDGVFNRYQYITTGENCLRRLGIFLGVAYSTEGGKEGLKVS